MESSDSVFKLIISRIQQENAKTFSTATEAAVQQSLKLSREDGSFSDIDYDYLDESRSQWKALTHINRLADCALAFTVPESSLHDNDNLYDALNTGLQYWHGRNLSSNNWWHNEIAIPQKLGVLLIQMRTGPRRLSEELEAKLLNIMEKNAGNAAAMTGANRTDVVLHWLYRACLTGNESLLAEAVAYAYEPIKLVDEGEGVQGDYSFFQHDRQLYLAGYGLAFLNGASLFALYTEGTPYALSAEQRKILGGFARESYFPIIRGQYSLFTVSGRGGLSRQRENFKAGSEVYARRLRAIDRGNAAFYDAAIKRLRGEESASYMVEAFHKYYPVGEYTLHTRPGYVFDVRLSSRRTGRIEYGNGENLKGYYASDGSTTIVRRGDEYRAVFSAWNWNRVPGITCVQNPDIPLPPKQWCVYGTSGFAGGVSDGMYGLTAYSYDAEYTGNSANKAWFFFDNEVVCLGSGIGASSVSGWDINTTVNQCLLAGDVTVSVNGTRSVLPVGDHFFTAVPAWALHDGIGYVFPSGGAAGIQNMARKGNWHDINRSGPDVEDTKELFTLWLDHGKNPANASYSYIVVPGAETAEGLEAYMQESAVEIQANNETVQAVYHRGLDMLGVVFYQAGVFEQGGLRVTADQGCVLMFRNITKKDAVMYAADPANSQSKITVTTVFPALSKGRKKKTVCDFSNTGVFAGAAKRYKL